MEALTGGLAENPQDSHSTYRLVVEERGKDLWVKTLTVGKHQIGRVSDCLVIINSPYASRVHCEITVHDDRVTLRDLNSRNGTFVNGQRLAPGEERTLCLNDMIRLAGTILTLVKT